MIDRELLVHIAVVLRELCASKGVSENEVYKATGVNIRQIENFTANPSVLEIEQLCGYFGIKESAFFEMVEQVAN